MWEACYALFRATQPGQVISWQSFGNAVGKDASLHGERHLVLTAVKRAIKELERNDRQTAVNVRGRGYRVIANEERLEMARKHQDRAAKEITLARKQVTNVDLSAMDSNTRRAFELTAMALRHQDHVISQTNIRQERLESVMGTVLEEQRLNAQEMSGVQQRLAALEARLNGTAPPPAVSAPGTSPISTYPPVLSSPPAQAMPQPAPGGPQWHQPYATYTQPPPR